MLPHHLLAVVMECRDGVTLQGVPQTSSMQGRSHQLKGGHVGLISDILKYQILLKRFFTSITSEVNTNLHIRRKTRPT